MKYLFPLFSLLLPGFAATAQQSVKVEILTSGTNTSLRGMSIPTADVIWVSGSNGMIGKSIDAGKTWRWMAIPGFETRDFRDIEAFDSSTAIAMAIDNPAYIVKTTDGGATWRKVFEKSMEGMFLDAMDFRDKQQGICIGDPLTVTGLTKKLFYIIRTNNGGETWQETPTKQLPIAQTGEAIFSASGTNISFLDNPKYEFAFVTGGKVSNLNLIGRRPRSKKSIPIPIIQGKETTGTFSMATDRQRTFYTIGGDYKAANDSTRNYYYSTNEGDTWSAAPDAPPFGYRSCIRIIEGKTLIACGTTGVDFAPDGQKEWKKVSSESFNVCMVSKSKQVFFAGEKGKIGMLIIKP